MSKLTPQQRLFAHEYVRNGGNATEAAKDAGYSARSAYSQGFDLLKKPEILAIVESLQAKQLAKVDASAERVKAELARLAFVDIGAAYGPDGALLPFEKMPEDVRRAVSGVDVEELFEGRGQEREHVGTLRKLKLWSKTEALNMLAKHHGLLRDIIEVKRDLDLDEITDEEWQLLVAMQHKVRGADEG